jgi:uncharacterized membrane-anchored protein
MKKTKWLLILWIGSMLSISAAEPSAAVANINWINGPAVGQLKATASIKVPAGYTFAGAKDTIVLMEAMQNPPTGTEMGFISPSDQDWFVVFEFDEAGYIRDDEKGNLDSDAMLKAIRQGTEKGNEERRTRGWAPINLLGWFQAPKYNERTNNLEWATRLESEGKQILNYNTRLLGRRGVMRVTLVADPQKISAVMPEFNRLMTGFSYNDGERYAEFRSGDKVAQYGLTALVVGGASAVAVKSGFLKSAWKLIVAAVVAAFAFLGKLFSKKSTS